MDAATQGHSMSEPQPPAVDHGSDSWHTESFQFTPHEQSDFASWIGLSQATGETEAQAQAQPQPHLQQQTIDNNLAQYVSQAAASSSYGGGFVNQPTFPVSNNGGLAVQPNLGTAAAAAAGNGVLNHNALLPQLSALLQALQAQAGVAAVQQGMDANTLSAAVQDSAAQINMLSTIRRQGIAPTQPVASGNASVPQPSMPTSVSEPSSQRSTRQRGLSTSASSTTASGQNTRSRQGNSGRSGGMPARKSTKASEDQDAASAAHDHDDDELSPKDKKSRNKLAAERYRKKKRLETQRLNGMVVALQSQLAGCQERIQQLEQTNKLLMSLLSAFGGNAQGAAVPQQIVQQQQQQQQQPQPQQQANAELQSYAVGIQPIANAAEASRMLGQSLEMEDNDPN